MEPKTIDGMEVVEYRNLQNGQSAMVTYAGQTITLDLGGKPLEETLDASYCAFVRDRESPSRIRALSIDGKPLYRPETMSLKEALSLKAMFLDGLFPGLEGYAFDCIRRFSPETMDYCLSYMPTRRAGIPTSVRQKVYAKCKGHCAYCGKKIRIDEMQVDHVDSHYRHQGKDELDNYLPACKDCNGLKSDYLLEEFRNVLIPSCAWSKSGRKGAIAKAYRLNGISKRKIVFYFEKMEEEK